MYRWIVIACCIISMPSSIAVALEPGQEQFVKAYVAAVNAKDVGGLKKLVHPKYLACINDNNRDFYDEYFAREVRKPIPEGYKLSSVAIGKDKPLLAEDAFSYPVRPTHWVRLDFERKPNEFSSIFRPIVELHDTWFMVVPCPKRETVKQFRKAKIEREKRKIRAKALFRELKDPLLSEVRALLKKGRKIQAWKRYSAETGESISMAKEVLSLVDIEKNPSPTTQ